MLDEDIENLRQYRGPGRFYPDHGDKRGEPKPDHPILIEDIKPYEMPAMQRADNERRADAARKQ